MPPQPLFNPAALANPYLNPGLYQHLAAAAASGHGFHPLMAHLALNPLLSAAYNSNAAMADRLRQQYHQRFAPFAAANGSSPPPLAPPPVSIAASVAASLSLTSPTSTSSRGSPPSSAFHPITPKTSENGSTSPLLKENGTASPGRSPLSSPSPKLKKETEDAKTPELRNMERLINGLKEHHQKVSS